MILSSALTFRNRIALVQGIESGCERLEGDELNDLAEASEVEDRVPYRLGVLADLIDAVRLENGVPGGRLEEKVERHPRRTLVRPSPPSSKQSKTPSFSLTVLILPLSLPGATPSP